MELRSIHDMDIDVDELERDMPEDMCLSVQPPCREYMSDPIWFNQVGRDPIDQRKIFQISSPEETRQKLAAVLEGWPRYGPAIYEKAAMQGRLDVIKILHELGAESDPKTMKVPDDDDVPLYLRIIEHAYFKAAIHGHLEIVKWFVEEGGVPIDYKEDDDDESSRFAFTYALTTARGGPYPEMARWLLTNGAPIVTNRKKGLDDLQCAIKGGSVECVQMILASEPAVRDGIVLSLDDIKYAAFSPNVGMVRFVLQSDCFRIEAPDEGHAGQGSLGLSEEQIKVIRDSLPLATAKGVLESVKLLLKQLTMMRNDGAFEPFKLRIEEQIAISNAALDALESYKDISEIFEILWDSCLHQPPDPTDQEAVKKALPPGEMLNRHLATASEHGCVKTVKLLVEKYHANINHVSHKFFTIPLARAAGSGKHPAKGRMEVIEYLCSRPNINMNLAMGEYCNSETALGHAIIQVPFALTRRKAELTEVVRLLLSLGGPVDVVDPDLQQRCDAAASDEMIDVYASLAREEGWAPVRLSLHESGKTDVLLKYSPRELRAVLRGIKIRPDGATLKANDPRGRPLIPATGEEVPEEERVKPTLLTGSDGVISV